MKTFDFIHNFFKPLLSKAKPRPNQAFEVRKLSAEKIVIKYEGMYKRLILIHDIIGIDVKLL